MSTFTESQATEIAKALSDPMRLRIYLELARHKEICVGELEACRVVSMPTVSHHLHVLMQAGLVCSERDGRYSFYRVIPERLNEYCLYFSSRVESSHVVDSRAGREKPKVRATAR
jgi:ArsR family transcriptional regulator